MRIGYARVSTADQSLDMQVSALEAAGCERIYEEKASGRKTDREELAKLLDYIREGDTLVVWKLDRLGRTVRQLMDLMADLDARGVAFVSLTESLDTSTPQGRFLVAILAAMAQMEAEVARERTMAGLAEARRQGRTGGRPRADMEAVRRAADAVEAGSTVTAACEDAGISRQTYYKYRGAVQAPYDRPHNANAGA